MKRVSALLFVATFAVALAAQRPDAFQAPYNHRAIGYPDGPLHDPLSQLNHGPEAGSAHLQFDPATGYLRSVLAALDVPIESQTLVFSHTSLQADLINFRSPRALYFNDSVAVAWVRGSELLELAAQDPRQGVIFYT